MLPSGGSQEECKGKRGMQREYDGNLLPAASRRPQFAAAWPRLIAACRVRGDYGNVEVHHFISAGIAHSGEIDMRSRRRVANILNIEKQEPRLGGVRLGRESAELGAVDFVELLLGLLVLVAEGNRNATRMSWIGAAG